MATFDWRAALSGFNLPQFDRTLAELASMNPAYQQQFLAVLTAAAKAGLNPVVMDGARSAAEQDALFSSGRGVTRAPGGSSYHNYGAAIDVVPAAALSDPNWMPDSPLWGQFGDAVRGIEGVRWGGDFQSIYDPSHVEIATTLDALRAAGDNGVQAPGAGGPVMNGIQPDGGRTGVPPVVDQIQPTPPLLPGAPGPLASVFSPPGAGLLASVFQGAPSGSTQPTTADADLKRRQSLAALMASLTQ